MNITANLSIVVIKLPFGLGNYMLAVHTIVILAQRSAEGIYEHFSISVRSPVTCLSVCAFDYQNVLANVGVRGGQLRLPLL